MKPNPTKHTDWRVRKEWPDGMCSSYSLTFAEPVTEEHVRQCSYVKQYVGDDCRLDDVYPIDPKP